MLTITDEMIAEAIGFADAEEILTAAFSDFGDGRAAMQPRVRCEVGGVKLSTLGAVIPAQGVLGAKVYSTIAGRFSFAILLFSADGGELLACLSAGEITRLRTAATSAIAIRHLVASQPRCLTVFGTGTLGRAHVEYLATALPLEEIVLCSRSRSDEIRAAMEAMVGKPVRFADPEAAVEGADVVVTASRSATPLVSGACFKTGAVIAAVGSSLPHARELDDTAVRRAGIVAVEWREQSFEEAGDLRLADPAALAGKVAELGEVIVGTAAPRPGPGDLRIFKSVGVGLEDIAVAGLAYRRITGH